MFSPPARSEIYILLHNSAVIHIATITRYNVTKPNGSHGDEAEVKGIKECQVFDHSEEVGTNAKKETEDQQTAKSCFDVTSKSHSFIVSPRTKTST